MTTIQQDKEQEIYSNFINSINSDVTRLNYELHVNLFKKFCNLSNLSELLIIEEQTENIKKILDGGQRGDARISRSFHTSRRYKIAKIRAITGGICCQCDNYNTHLLKYKTQGVVIVERYCSEHVPKL